MSDAAKYLQRGSLFEAAHRIERVRHRALKLFAAAHDVPYPLFGLTSLPDYEPFRRPGGLADTLPAAWQRASIEAAGAAVVALLTECSKQAASHLGHNPSTAWEDTARARLSAATLNPATQRHTPWTRRRTRHRRKANSARLNT